MRQTEIDLTSNCGSIWLKKEDQASPGGKSLAEYMFRELHHVDLRTPGTCKHSFAAHNAFIGRKSPSIRFHLDANSNGFSEAPTSGTAKVVRLPFKDDSKHMMGQATGATYIVGVAGKTTTLCFSTPAHEDFNKILIRLIEELRFSLHCSFASAKMHLQNAKVHSVHQERLRPVHVGTPEVCMVSHRPKIMYRWYSFRENHSLQQHSKRSAPRSSGNDLLVPQQRRCVANSC